MKRRNFMTKAAVFVLAASMLSACGSADEEKNTGKRKRTESVFESDETEALDDSFELSYEDIDGFISDISDCLIGKFEGILDGNYHVISGSKCSLINSLIGTVKNLAFENVDAQSAVLADNMGYMGSVSIENCYVTGTITDGSGGLINEISVTNNDVSIINCYNKSNITSDDYYHVNAVGGIVGRVSFEYAYGKTDIMIDNC